MKTTIQIFTLEKLWKKRPCRLVLVILSVCFTQHVFSEEGASEATKSEKKRCLPVLGIRGETIGLNCTQKTEDISGQPDARRAKLLKMLKVNAESKAPEYIETIAP